MAEYIRRADAMKVCQDYSSHCFLTNDATGQDIADRIENDIVDIPTADVEKVRHGEWIRTGDRTLDNLYAARKCSECGSTRTDDEAVFCSRCGAKMDGKQEA